MWLGAVRMKLSDALLIVLDSGGPGVCVLDCSAELHEARRVMKGHLKQLIKREEGRKDTELTEVQVYQEYHHQNVDDIGVAFNEDRVWVCLDGVSLFRAKAYQGRMLTEYHGR